MAEPSLQRQVEIQDEEEELLQAKSLAGQITPVIQRQVEEEEEEELLQAKSQAGQTPKVTPVVANQINALRGSGEPLPESARDFFEPRFGQDFSQVRVHSDARAAETAKSVNARALPWARMWCLHPANILPRLADGQQLLAHELTHVLQQDEAGRVPGQRTPASHHASDIDGASIVSGGASERSPLNPWRLPSRCSKIDCTGRSPQA